MRQKTEATIQKAIGDLLELDGWRRLRTTPVSRREWGTGFGEVGMADDLFIRYENRTQANFRTKQFWGQAKAEVLWIEHKTPKGKPSQKQLEWHRSERARGALTLIAGIDFKPSPEGFFNWYRNSGLMRRTLTFKHTAENRKAAARRRNGKKQLDQLKRTGRATMVLNPGKGLNQPK